MSSYAAEKKLVREYMSKIDTCSVEDIEKTLKEFVSDDYKWEGSYPFMDLEGATAVAETFWTPVKNALHSIQRRQDIFMAGTAKDGKTWVMSMGHLMGMNMGSFLKIPRSGKLQHLHYYEFSLVENGKIAHTALYVDIIAYMKHAGLSVPLLETGKYFVYPGPIDHNGLLFDECDPAKAKAAEDVVDNMIHDMYHDDCTKPEVMARCWAKDMIWYGPCGVGTSYTIPGYQKQHQLPFRLNMTDRKSLGRNAFFAEGDFVCFYSDLQLSSKGGWLGMPGGAKNIVLRGDLDIYYCKDGKIKENWCYFDIPYWLYQQGTDIIERTVSILNPED